MNVWVLYFILSLRTPWHIWRQRWLRLIGPTILPNKAIRPFKPHQEARTSEDRCVRVLNKQLYEWQVLWEYPITYEIKWVSYTQTTWELASALEDSLYRLAIAALFRIIRLPSDSTEWWVLLQIVAEGIASEIHSILSLPIVFIRIGSKIIVPSVEWVVL